MEAVNIESALGLVNLSSACVILCTAVDDCGDSVYRISGGYSKLQIRVIFTLPIVCTAVISIAVS